MTALSPKDHATRIARCEAKLRQAIADRDAAVLAALSREGATLRSVAQEFGLSNQRVDQIRKRGMRQ